MKTTIVLLFALVMTAVNGQTYDFETLMDSAKQEFKKEFEKQDYHKAVDYLEKAVKLKPENSEARYFLGYAYSRINSKDGRSIISMSLDLTLKSSEQFEMINKVEPGYNGEMLILDPYSKITSEWGSLAMCYRYNNKPDSAKWAFSEGKKRGGFGNYFQALNRKVLDACSQNAILISSGDNFTIQLSYLQFAEGYRKDVSVVDISLLNTTWYPAYLSKNNIVSFDLPSETMDTIEYCSWKDSMITINNFSWIVKPSYYEQFILRGDRLFLSLLRQNKFQRDLFFTIGFTEESRLSLKDYITPLLIVDKLTISDKTEQTYNEYKNSMVYLLKLSAVLNMNSPDEWKIFDYYRYNLLGTTDDYLTKNDKTKAKELLDLLDKYADDKNFPYQNPKGKEFVDYLKLKL